MDNKLIYTNHVVSTLLCFIIALGIGAVPAILQAQELSRPADVPVDYVEATIKELFRNPGAWDGTKVFIRGVVDRYDESGANNKINTFQLEDVFGYRIRVQTAETLPEAKAKLAVWGEIKGDPNGQELYLVMKSFIYSDREQAKPAQAEKSTRILLFAACIALLVVVATLLTVMAFRKRPTVKSVAQVSSSDELQLQTAPSQGTDDSATIRIDPENIKILQLDDPTIKILPGHFVFTKGENQGKSIPICFNQVTIGRACPHDPVNKIAIEDPTRTISRNQAILTYEEGVFYLENKADPGQKNCTVLNGEPMDRDEKRILARESIISVGYVELRYVDGPIPPVSDEEPMQQSTERPLLTIAAADRPTRLTIFKK
jgi:hypothetical protein